MTAKSLPVLMHHYISRHANSIAVPPEIFEAQCKAMAEAGWRGVSLAEAEAYFLRKEPLPAKSCLITFDDGYLDNYVYAWPILEKYGHKGVIFAVAARIEEEGEPRPTLADVWSGIVAKEALPNVDNPFFTAPEGYTVRRDAFINWNEARRMEKSGVMAVASHTHAHQGVPINGTYDGFFLPEKRLRAFDRPSPFFWGHPRFPMKAGLSHKAFIPDPKLSSGIRELVPQDEAGAHAFAMDAAGMGRLENLVASFGADIGRMETDQETRDRMREEIAKGKTLLEERLGHAVTTLCWPWGEYNDESLGIARELGFSVFITVREGANPPGRPLAVCRFKVRAKGGMWLRSRLWLYAHPVLASLYAKARL